MNSNNELDERLEELLSTLPKEKHWDGSTDIVLYQGFWCLGFALKSLVAFQTKFNALDDDVVLASSPKAGTTWSKALLYIVNRGRFPDITTSPLQHTSPMELLPTADTYFLPRIQYFMDIESTTRPRVVPTHSPYSGLPDSIKTNGACKIVYIWRNPMDQFVSFWHFSQTRKVSDVDRHLTLEQCFDQFCKGVSVFGPFWDHILGYWKASQEAPTKVLMLKYEDLKGDPVGCVRKIADFSGCPFSPQEEENGIVDQIVGFCSFESMKNMEANRNGTLPTGLPNAAYFRKGVVGDSANYFTPPMVDRLVQITREKWAGTDLSFHPHPLLPN